MMTILTTFVMTRSTRSERDQRSDHDVISKLRLNPGGSITWIGLGLMLTGVERERERGREGGGRDSAWFL